MLQTSGNVPEIHDCKFMLSVDGWPEEQRNQRKIMFKGFLKKSRADCSVDTISTNGFKYVRVCICIYEYS